MTVRRWGFAACVAGALALAIPAGVSAQAKTKPADATAQCKDGTYSSAKTKRGACSGHGGVTTWYADESTKNTKAAAKETKTAAKTDTKAAAIDTKTAAKSADKDTKTAAKETKGAAPTMARPADAPADATAQCNDGTFSKAKTHQGACSSHKGVKAWFK